VSAAAQFLDDVQALNTAVQAAGRYLSRMKVDDDLLIGVLADQSCDIGRVVHEMCRLGDSLATADHPCDCGDVGTR
jgi:hypothetical protein